MEKATVDPEVDSYESSVTVDSYESSVTVSKPLKTEVKRGNENQL